MNRFSRACLIVIAACTGSVALAQDAAVASSGDLEELRACRAIADPTERLACYDREVGVVIAATDDGSLQVVDKEEVEQTKRRLFGFSLPKLRIFGGDDEEIKLLQTTITRVRQIERDSWVITTEEGSVWRIKDAPMRFRAPRTGQGVEFKKASLGSYFIRVNGQLGVKGRRIE
ncbi:hypothetical protein [Parerythrobacter jejuensis]|uniref:Uncharacterized protein n=1 Tax=Parerythrobacter jejuensis TaxID=795812 RepID=A0A845AST9_9SPHN|nr:hypothetical protein [Parerythrobacter jejuensis]MXP31576.1 hypothetical protein [Parerythrobacter jejuensis]